MSDSVMKDAPARRRRSRQDITQIGIEGREVALGMVREPIASIVRWERLVRADRPTKFIVEELAARCTLDNHVVSSVSGMGVSGFGHSTLHPAVNAACGP